MEQLEIFRAESHESVADRFNAWMITNGNKVDAIVDIEFIIDYITSNDSLSDNSRYEYLIRLRYRTTLAKIT